MHEHCADYAAKTCPFVSGERDYSHRPVNHNVMKVEVMASAVRPRHMYILRTRTKKIGFVNVNGSRMIQASAWSKQKEIEIAKAVQK